MPVSRNRKGKGATFIQRAKVLVEAESEFGTVKMWNGSWKHIKHTRRASKTKIKTDAENNSEKIAEAGEVGRESAVPDVEEGAQEDQKGNSAS